MPNLNDLGRVLLIVGGVSVVLGLVLLLVGHALYAGSPRLMVLDRVLRYSPQPRVSRPRLPRLPE